MIFPFEITRKYDLLDSEFGDYSSTEIIDNIYKFLLNEEFKSIRKDNNEITISGDRNRWKRQFNWFKTDRMTHCIDKGIVTLSSINNKRTIIYTYQIKTFLIWFIPETILFPILFGLLFWSIDTGFSFFWIILTFDIVYWIYLMIVHPATVSAPIEIMRFEAIKKKTKK
jgi:hypothetical protein